MNHLSMRRSDRAIPREDTLAVLDAAAFATVATVDADGMPYGVPLSYARQGDILYFHAANEGGLKADCFRRDARACATAVVDVEAFFENGDFSTSYRSAIAFGRMRPVDDPIEFKHALVNLCMKYLPAHKHAIGKAMEIEGPHTAVWALDLEKLSGKANPFPAGEDTATRASTIENAGANTTGAR